MGRVCVCEFVCLIIFYNNLTNSCEMENIAGRRRRCDGARVKRRYIFLLHLHIIRNAQHTSWVMGICVFVNFIKLAWKSTHTIQRTKIIQTFSEQRLPCRGFGSRSSLSCFSNSDVSHVFNMFFTHFIRRCTRS